MNPNLNDGYLSIEEGLRTTTYREKVNQVKLQGRRGPGTDLYFTAHSRSLSTF